VSGKAISTLQNPGTPAGRGADIRLLDGFGQE